MPDTPVDTPLRQAIGSFGDQKQAAAILCRSQGTISTYVTSNRAPAEVCMRIEVLTKGKYRAEDLRPDLADVFAEFRAATPKRRRRAA